MKSLPMLFVCSALPFVKQIFVKQLLVCMGEGGTIDNSG